MNDRIFKGESSSPMDLIASINMRISKWALIRKEFSNFSLNDIIYNWEACMVCSVPRIMKVEVWCPPARGLLKFNVDGAARGKPGPAGVGGVLRDHKGDVLLMFSKNVGIKESNETEVLAILEAL